MRTHVEVAIAIAAPNPPVYPVVENRWCQQVDGRLGLGDVDMLALAGALAGVEGGRNGGRARQAVLEREALALWETDKSAAAQRLTESCANVAREACREADRLNMQLQSGDARRAP